MPKRWLARLAGLFGAVVVATEATRLATGPHAPRSEPKPEALEAGHETKDADWRIPVGVGIFLIVGAVVMHLALGAIMHSWKQNAFVRPNPASALAPELKQIPPEPRLQKSPQEDLKRHRGEVSRILTNYGWVDRKAGIVRIPIERAMERIAHE